MQGQDSNRKGSAFQVAQSLLLVLCFLSTSSGYALDYWITPNETLHSCPLANSSTRCLTLTELLVLTNTSMLSAINASNKTANESLEAISIRFLPGKHIPYQSGWINTNKTNILLTGDRNNHSIIECTPDHTIGFLFDDIKSLEINYLIIKGCGYNSTDVPAHSLNENNYRADSKRLNAHATFLLFNIEDVRLIFTSVLNNSEFGLVIIEPKNRVSIGYAHFSANTHSSHPNKGNIFVLSNYYLTIRIKNTTISNGSGSLQPLIWSGLYRERYVSGGITIWLITGQATYIYLDNLTVENNNASKGGGLYMTSVGSFDITCQGDLIVHISSCEFRNNRARIEGGAIYRNYLFSTNCLGLELYGADYSSTHINNSCFNGNTAQISGGGVHIETEILSQNFQNKLVNNGYTVSVTHSQFKHNKATLGGAMYLDFIKESVKFAELIPTGDNRNLLFNVPFTVNESIFDDNEASESGGALLMTIHELTDASLVNVITKFDKSTFNGNFASEGSGITIRSLKRNDSGLSVTMQNSNFTDNRCLTIGTRSSLSVIHLSEVKKILLDTITIENNSKCRGIYSNMSSIEVEGKISIKNHTSERGAGILFGCKPLSATHRTSQLLFYNPNASLVIQDNHASLYGGGIAIEAGCTDPELCFFRGLGNQSALLKDNISIFLDNNTAEVGGNSIYGGYLEYCIIENETLDFQTFDSIFEISETDLPSVVSSQPYKVCICNSSYNHNCQLEHNVSTYPGQPFHVPVIGVSDYNNSFPSIIRATLDESNNIGAFLEDIQLTQQVGLECKELPYTISTNIQNEQLLMALKIDDAFSAGTIVTDFIESKVYVQIKHCPLGFELNETVKRCLCTSYLKAIGVSCNIENIKIRKTSISMWLGTFSNEIVAHNNCPLDFCKRDSLDVDPYNQSDQCDYNREGVLCGACKPGSSLMLGSSRCGRCSDTYIFLLLPFTLVGVALVVLLLKCDLTVSTGTINGLIFYVNILQANRSVYFPNLSSRNSFSSILAVLVAWLNLDLGIETCLSSSITAYIRTWLQFVFPIYIWLMVAILIVVSRYSVIVSKFTGSNTVSVLATLFLLSYAKVLRATLNSVSATRISGSNSSHLVWLLDGNYSFATWPHSLLFAFSLIMLLFYIIPFTFVLLLTPLLQAFSNHKYLRWVNKVNPFIDAYQGPYRKKLRFWTGWMLLVRLVLFIAFAANILGNPRLNIMLILLATVSLLAIWWKYGHIYRCDLPYNDYLEIFYLVNLAITSSITLYFSSTPSSDSTAQEVLTCITIGSGLLVFLLILVYHSYLKIKQTKFGKKLSERFQKDESTLIEDNDVVPIIQPLIEPTCTIVTINKNQQPLLVSEGDSETDDIEALL